MKKIIDSLFVPLLVAVLVGYILGNYVYKSYKENIDNDLRSSRLYLIQNGEYDSMDLMREENSNNNYVYYEDDNKYKTCETDVLESRVGYLNNFVEELTKRSEITRNYDNIDKIKSLYSDNLKVMEYYVSADFLDSKQDEYDKMLASADDIYEVREVVDNILELYRSDDSVRLIAIN